ncbi:U3 small nucleolar RNA-associated protein 13, partial [Ascosphaera acerosa]
TNSLLATGAADGSVKVWDLRRGFATHTFHGHGGVVSALRFFQQTHHGHQNNHRPADGRVFKNDPQSRSQVATHGFRLASGSEDGKVRVWDLHRRKPLATLDAHVSVVRAIAYAPADDVLLTASRDKTLIVWDAATWKLRRLIPALESVEAAGFLADESLCYAAGESGRLRIWDHARGGEITEETQGGEDDASPSESDAVVSVQYHPSLPFILTVHVDQTLRLHSLAPLHTLVAGARIPLLPVVRRLAGNDDEIIDIACAGPDRSIAALATNSEFVRLVDTTERKQSGEDDTTTPPTTYFGADLAHLEGHADIIICLAVDWSGHWLATGAKDNTARVWRIDPRTATYECVATLTGHAESLGAIAFDASTPPANSAAHAHPLAHPPAFLITGSQDKTVKRWVAA